MGYIPTRIINRESEIKTLKIGFMAYNTKLTRDLFKWFCRNNEEEITKYDIQKYKAEAIFRDGTKVFAILSAPYEPFWRGVRTDQLILCDDERWDIYHERHNDIYNLKEYNMNTSNVPDEYQILEYLYDKNIDE